MIVLSLDLEPASERLANELVADRFGFWRRLHEWHHSKPQVPRGRSLLECEQSDRDTDQETWKSTETVYKTLYRVNTALFDTV